MIDRKWMQDTRVLHSLSIKNIFYDKIELRLFYFDVAIYPRKTIVPEIIWTAVSIIFLKCSPINFFEKRKSRLAKFTDLRAMIITS